MNEEDELLTDQEYKHVTAVWSLSYCYTWQDYTHTAEVSALTTVNIGEKRMDTKDQGAHIEPLLPTVKSSGLVGQIFTYVD